MNLSRLAVILAVMTATSTILAQTLPQDPKPYDVRHLRWGMKQEEVLAAEPNSNCTEATVKQNTFCSGKDLVVGVESSLMFLFMDESLARSCSSRR